MGKTKKSYCRQNGGDCETCSLFNGRDCQGNLLDESEITKTPAEQYRLLQAQKLINQFYGLIDDEVDGGESEARL